MAFWDWLFDPTGETRGKNPRAVSGSPTSIYGRAGQGSGAGPDFSKTLLDTAKYVMDNSGRGGNPTRFSGGRFGRSGGDTSFTGRKRNKTAGTSIEDILATLEQLQDPSRYLGDEDFTDEAMAAASAQYDPVIAALRSQASGASDRANRNYTQLGQMFSALSSDLQGDIPEIQQMYAGDKTKLDQSYDSLEKSITDQYASTQADQEAMMKRLNIEAAASEILPQQMRDRDFFTNMAASEGQTMQSALGQEERGAVEYTRQGSQIARSEGTSRQADLMAELQDLLNQYDSQIGAQQSAKQNAYTALLGQMQSDSQGNAMDMAQRDFQNYISMIQLGRDLRKDESAGSGAVKYTKSPADVAARALSLGLDESGAQDIQDVFMSALANDVGISSGVDALWGNKMTDEALAKRVMEAGRKDGLSREELNALQAIALEYFRG